MSEHKYKLYEYTENYENLEKLLEDNPDLDIKEALDNIKENSKEKITNTAGFIKKLEDDLKMIEGRRSELKEMQDSKKKQINKIKDYLLEHMQRMDIQKVDTGTRVVRYQNNRPSLNILDNEKVPEIFKKRIVTLETGEEDLPQNLREKLVESKLNIDKNELMKYINSLEEEEYKDYAQKMQTKSLRIK